ncbi:chalcone isomerase family protein [Schlegelella sp. S2-27]|uniref:Chalcone isomerase family protein n=1 Tax=Caldimonas mangrovi TaxID=2944811 RepID=A0ABT0YYD4_9BURK|nr:chalcone isomerase family protein [Caldimonas mangrovi]MCM5682848.1 chalcone isomerase family protein [Caldimonas mangrovi]
MFRPWFSALAIALIGLGAAHAQATEVAGVKFDQQIQLNGAPLQLNGAGVRYKAIFKVYAAGLYLTRKAATPEAVMAATGPRRLNIVMLRDIDANELGKLFTRGMEQNASREDFVKSIPGTIKMGEIFAAKKKLASGESFQVDWVPGQGTYILVNGKPMAEPIKEPEFYTSLIKIWLGHHPADATLKDALLGKEKDRAANS